MGSYSWYPASQGLPDELLGSINSSEILEVDSDSHEFSESMYLLFGFFSKP